MPSAIPRAPGDGTSAEPRPGCQAGWPTHIDGARTTANAGDRLAHRAGARSPDPPRAGEEATDFLAEVGAEVGCLVVFVPVVGDAVEDVPLDRPAAAGGPARDEAVDREVERPGGKEREGVVAEEGPLAADALGFAVEGRGRGVAVDVEYLLRRKAPGDARRRRPPWSTAGRARWDARPRRPRRCSRCRSSASALSCRPTWRGRRRTAAVRTGSPARTPSEVEPPPRRAGSRDAVTSGEDDAVVGRVDGSAGAAAEPERSDDEDHPVTGDIRAPPGRRRVRSSTSPTWSQRSRWRRYDARAADAQRPSPLDPWEAIFGRRWRSMPMGFARLHPRRGPEGERLASAEPRAPLAPPAPAQATSSRRATQRGRRARERLAPADAPPPGQSRSSRAVYLCRLVGSGGRQRRPPESNRCKRLCRPLRSHSARAPGGLRVAARRRWARAMGS